MLRSVLLVSHVAAGGAGLLLGPAAMAAALSDRRHSRSASAYRVAVGVLTATAAGLVALKPALWPFVLLAAGTEAAVLMARTAPPSAATCDWSAGPTSRSSPRSWS